MSYTVFVDDNYHFMDESERYIVGEYGSLEEAEAKCREIVDDFLGSLRGKRITAAELARGWASFGESPGILSDNFRHGFSAAAYARKRCAELGAAEAAVGKKRESRRHSGRGWTRRGRRHTNQTSRAVPEASFG